MDIKKLLGQDMGIPILIKNGQGFDAQFFVSIDSHFLDVHGNITTGIHRLFQSSFVFHLQYPSQALHFYRLFERIAKISTIPPSPAIDRILDKIMKTVVE